MTKKPFAATVSYHLAQLAKAHRQRAEELLSRVGLHTGQEFILMRLWSEDGCAQTELVSDLCVQPATITKSIDRLESAGFLERRPDPQDRRISRVYLTDEGRALQKKVEALWHELEATTFGSLSAAEQDTLRRLLSEARKNLM